MEPLTESRKLLPKKKGKLYLHNIGQHCTTRGDEHDGTLDGVVIADETLHSQVN